VLIEKRLHRCFEDFLSAMARKQTTIVKHIADSWAEEMRFGRLLRNVAVTPERILHQATSLTRDAVAGRHILLVEDTSEFSFGLEPRASGLGSVGNGTERGFFIHPVLAIDADRQACLGLAAAQIFDRPKLPDELQDADLQTRRNYLGRQPFSEKSSKRWLDLPLLAQQCCQGAARMTVVADREADIYAALNGFIEAKLDFVIRLSKDRPLHGAGTERRKQQLAAARARKKNPVDPEQQTPQEASVPGAAATAEPQYQLIATVKEQLNALPVAGTCKVKLPATDKRMAHEAVLDVKFIPVALMRPRTANGKGCNEMLPVYVVEVREQAASVVGKDAPIHWILYTTNAVTTVTEALQVVEWYRWRWHIEQTFRLLKSRGLDMENSGLQTRDRLANLAAMALVAAVRVLQLVLARDHGIDQQLRAAFTPEEIEVLEALNKTLEGNTARQRNPHPRGSLAYGSWVIARLGSWNGYSGGRPGPITMYRGLAIFYQRYEGYQLAKRLT